MGFLYAATASWSLPYHADAASNMFTGWYLGTDGSVIATEHGDLVGPEQRGNIGWFVTSPRGPVSQYAPGTALLVAPFYAVVQPEAPVVEIRGANAPDLPVSVPLPPVWPATLSAVIVTALALGVLAAVVHGMGASVRHALGFGLLAGTATGAWSVASGMSWTHGPTILAIALGLLAASRERWLLAGLAIGAGILVRPHVALIAAALGIGVGIARRDWKPVVLVALGSVVGMVALLAYNWWLWSELTVSGGYLQGFPGRLASAGLGATLANVARGLVSPRYGLVTWAPFLLVLVPAAWLVRRELPDWTVAAAVGGVLYLAVQWRVNRASGGAGFFGYRYPLAALTAAAPALWLGWDRWVRQRPVATRLLVATLAVAAAGQAAGAVLT